MTTNHKTTSSFYAIQLSNGKFHNYYSMDICFWIPEEVDSPSSAIDFKIESEAQEYLAEKKFHLLNWKDEKKRHHFDGAKIVLVVKTIDYQIQKTQ